MYIYSIGLNLVYALFDLPPEQLAAPGLRLDPPFLIRVADAVCQRMVPMLLPLMRRVPIAMAKVLGNLAADLAWFPIAYLFVVFGAVPVVLLLLSLAGGVVVGIFGSLLFIGFGGVICVLTLRKTKPDVLPAAFLRDPRWMPPWVPWAV